MLSSKFKNSESFLRRKGKDGKSSSYGIAEYKSSNSPEEFHLAIYDSKTGQILASVYNTATGMNESYNGGAKGRDCAAIITAMFPALMGDEEFRKYFYKVYDDFNDNFPHLSEAKKNMGVLCDNVYRRITDESCPAHLPLNIDKSGNIFRVSQTHIESGKYIPKSRGISSTLCIKRTSKSLILIDSLTVPPGKKRKSPIFAFQSV